VLTLGRETLVTSSKGLMLYEVRINGRLSAATLEEFPEYTASIEPAKTVLRGRALDVAALNELLDRAARLGLEVSEVREVAPDGA
jgi:hypothetical protein